MNFLKEISIRCWERKAEQLRLKAIEQERNRLEYMAFEYASGNDEYTNVSLNYLRNNYKYFYKTNAK